MLSHAFESYTVIIIIIQREKLLCDNINSNYLYIFLQMKTRMHEKS